MELQILKIQDENEKARKENEDTSEKVEGALADQNLYQAQNKNTLETLREENEKCENDYKLLKKIHEDELNIKNKEIEEVAKKEEGLLKELKAIQDKKEYSLFFLRVYREENKKVMESHKQVELAESKVLQLQEEINKK